MRLQARLCMAKMKVHVGETGVSWHIFQKNAHKTQESLISGMSDSEKVDIYVTNSRYKNVQTIYDYFKKIYSEGEKSNKVDLLILTVLVKQDWKRYGVHVHAYCLYLCTDSILL